MKRAIAIAIATLVLAACVTDPKVIYKTRTVTKHVPQCQAVPAEFTEPLPEPTLPPDATNGDLDQLASKQGAIIRQANQDRQAVREAACKSEEDGP